MCEFSFYLHILYVNDQIKLQLFKLFNCFMSVPGLYISFLASATLRHFSGFLHLSHICAFSNFTKLLWLFRALPIAYELVLFLFHFVTYVNEGSPCRKKELNRGLSLPGKGLCELFQPSGAGGSYAQIYPTQTTHKQVLWSTHKN